MKELLKDFYIMSDTHKGYLPNEVYKVEAFGNTWKLIDVNGVKVGTLGATTRTRRGAYDEGKALQAHINKNGKKTFRKVDMELYNSLTISKKSEIIDNHLKIIVENESGQFEDSNHKGIFIKILNKLIIIRDCEEKLMIKNKSIASEGYYDSEHMVNEQISSLRWADGFINGGPVGNLFLWFFGAGCIYAAISEYSLENIEYRDFKIFLMIGGVVLIFAWMRVSDYLDKKNKIIQELTNKKNNNLSKRKHKFNLEKKIESVWKEIDILEKKYVKQLQNYFIKKYDKNNNGKLDEIEDSHDYMNLLEKNQEKIISISEKMGEDYIHTLVKIDEKLTLKKESLNLLLNKILNYDGRFNEESNIEVFEDLLKKEINFYNVLLNASLFMASSLINDDRIGFRKLYQLFDKMNFFNSNYENKVLELFSNVNENLNTIIHKIDDMNFSIVGAIQDLSYVTEKGMDNLSNDLKSVNSSINLNNLIAGINAYQNYKTNQRLK